MPRIVVCPPGPVPGARSALNRFGVARPDNRAVEEPPVRRKRSSGLRHPPELNLDVLEERARRALSRAVAEREEKGKREEPPIDADTAARLMPSTVPAHFAHELRAK